MALPASSNFSISSRRFSVSPICSSRPFFASSSARRASSCFACASGLTALSSALDACCIALSALSRADDTSALATGVCCLICSAVLASSACLGASAFSRCGSRAASVFSLASVWSAISFSTRARASFNCKSGSPRDLSSSAISTFQLGPHLLHVPDGVVLVRHRLAQRLAEEHRGLGLAHRRLGRLHAGRLRRERRRQHAPDRHGVVLQPRLLAVQLARARLLRRLQHHGRHGPPTDETATEAAARLFLHLVAALTLGRGRHHLDLERPLLGDGLVQARPGLAGHPPAGRARRAAPAPAPARCRPASTWRRWP